MVQKEWRVINTGVNNGYTNMAIDEAIMTGVNQGMVPPTLRFYRWAPPAVTIGYFQDVHREIDLNRCRQLGVDVVRRLTGGRAVLHHQEVTYSLICSEEEPVATGTIIQSYLRISQGLLAGIRKLGIPAELVPHGVKKSEIQSPACFEAPSWYELVAHGKKLIGSAQTRKKGILLQHGSIPLNMDIELLRDILKFKTAGAKEVFLSKFAEKAGSINQFLGKPVNEDVVMANIVTGLEQALNIKFSPNGLTTVEEEYINKLKAKYSSNDWNWGKGKRVLR